MSLFRASESVSFLWGLDIPLQSLAVGLGMNRTDGLKPYKYRSQEGIEAAIFVCGEDETEWLYPRPYLYKIYDVNTYEEEDPERYEKRLALWQALWKAKKTHLWYEMLNEFNI